jgi:hypothetical protein
MSTARVEFTSNPDNTTIRYAKASGAGTTKRPSRLILALILASFAAGCASGSGYPERSGEVSERLVGLHKKYFQPGKDVRDVYDKESTADKRAYRDEVVFGRMMAIDLQFSIFSETIYKEGVSTNLSLDVVGVGVGVAGSVVTGAGASRILSALSGGISGGRTAINKNLYYEQTMPALMALMVAEREKIKAEIIAGLQQDVDKYSLGQALVHLERYFNAGSIPGAIATVTKEAGATGDEAEQAMTATREAAFDDVAAVARFKKLYNQVSALPDDALTNILNNPPSELDAYIKAAIAGREAKTFDNVLKDVEDKPDKAREILKIVLGLIMKRSKEDLDKWEAAMAALISS